MTKILLIGKDCRSKAKYLESFIPIFYMQDFSIQGITVDNFTAACGFIDRAKDTVLDKNDGADIIFDDIKQLAAMQGKESDAKRLFSCDPQVSQRQNP